jgi:hypothetical protein
MVKENKTIVQKQIKLPLAKAVEISIKSLKIRLGRSMITTASIIFAISFLMAIFTSNSLNLILIKYGKPELRIILEESIKEIKVQQLWLIVLSLLICVIGIINSMLMVVTERYKEIGTMKCLGALNKFVVELFILESTFQGLFGSIVGVLLGVFSITLINLINNGWLIIKYYPWSQIVMYSFISILTGVFLSVIGAIYPAYVAAKMVPADALRTEI